MTQYNIFGASQPDFLALPYDSPPDLDAVNVGTYFISTIAGFITHIRFWGNPYDTNDHHDVGLYDFVSHNLLGSGTTTSLTPNAWNEVALAEPVAISPDTYYGAVVFYPVAGYVKKEHFLDARYTNTPLAAELGGGAYNYSPSMQIPLSVYNNTCYFVDVVMVDSLPDPTPPEVDMDEEQKLEAAQAAYDAWWAAQEGRNAAGWLKRWPDLTEAEKEFYVVFVETVETYIAGLA